jgi:hypothetical protein
MRPYLEKLFTKIGRVAQGEGPEFKPQYCKKSKKCQYNLSSHHNRVGKKEAQNEAKVSRRRQIIIIRGDFKYKTGV